MKIKKLGIRAASGLWNPRSLNPILWFDAQDITTITKTRADLLPVGHPYKSAPP